MMPQPTTTSWGVLLIGLVAGVLLVIACAVVIQVFASAYGRKLPVRETLLSIAALLWCLPAVAILGYLSVAAAPHLNPVKPRVEAPPPPLPPVPPPVLAPEKPDADIHSAALQAEQEPQPVPAWTRELRTVSSHSTRLVLTSRQYSTREEALQEALLAAAELVQQDFEKSHPVNGVTGEWHVSLDDVRRHAMLRVFDETKETDFGSFTAPMRRVYLQVELSPEVRAKLYPSWREHVVTHRLWVLGTLVGLLTLMLGTSAAYFRLDSLTNGLYRRRLKLAAVSLIVAGGLFTGLLLQS